MFSFLSKCQAENVKFIQVTDVHLTQHNSLYLRQFVQDVNQKFNDIDFIVFTGDNLDKANEEDLKLFLSIIKELKFKTYVLPGNHYLSQTKDMTKEHYMHLIRKKLGFYHSDKANYVFKKKDIVFIAMNGVKEVIPSPNGYFREEELVWLDKMLSKYADKKLVILQHFPLLYTNVANHNLYRIEDYKDVLNKHDNVISVVSGHYHENVEIRENNIYHIVTKNFSENRFYKIIEINTEDDFIFTILYQN